MELAQLADRLTEVRQTITAACLRVNRPADSVKLIAVSKTHPPDAVLQAVACGLTQFGENRIEEAADKIQSVTFRARETLTWHMIGHVQSRKARDVIANFAVIHSLDSLKLAERYSRFAVEMDRQVTVLLECNVSGEESKSGYDLSNWRESRDQRESLWSDIRRIIELQGIHLAGLMTMAPLVNDPEQARPTFIALRLLREALAADFPMADWAELSMGMTDDYAVAIEEGATMVRIGRAIFGPRTM